jgi:capsular exopolysaccharide synthesis family protein
VRSNLLTATAGMPHPVVAVTSARDGEGKTSTSVGLAWSLAATGLRVTLVDLDLRHPAAHKVIGTRNDVGVTDVLLGDRSVDECLQFLEPSATSVGRTGVQFLPAGQQVANPTEALAARRMRDLVARLAGQSEIMILDTPPVLPVADTLVICGLASGALLVVQARRTPAPEVQRARDALVRNQTRVFGVVLNRFKPAAARYPATGSGLEAVSDGLRHNGAGSTPGHH